MEQIVRPYAHDQVRLIHFFLLKKNGRLGLAFSNLQKLRLLARASRSKDLIHRLPYRLWINITCYAYHDILSRIGAIQKLDKVAALESFDIRFRTGYVPSQWRITIKKCLVVFLDTAHRHVLVHIDFLEYRPPLAIDFLRLDLGIEKEIGHDVERVGPMLSRYFGIIAGVFLAGKGIVFGTEAIELF